MRHCRWSCRTHAKTSRQRVLDAGKREPSGGGNPDAGSLAYGTQDPQAGKGDPLGLRAKTEQWLR